jgi:CheY-like chemotaxis protein
VQSAAQEGRPYEIVLMDLQMPEMGGIEATRELRRQFSAADLPIIALTAAALVSERDAATAAGMNDFLTKPLDTVVLHRMLCRWLPHPGDSAQASTLTVPG